MAVHHHFRPKINRSGSTLNLSPATESPGQSNAISTIVITPPTVEFGGGNRDENPAQQPQHHQRPLSVCARNILMSSLSQFHTLHDDQCPARSAQETDTTITKDSPQVLPPISKAYFIYSAEKEKEEEKEAQPQLPPLHNLVSFIQRIHRGSWKCWACGRKNTFSRKVREKEYRETCRGGHGCRYKRDGACLVGWKYEGEQDLSKRVMKDAGGKEKQRVGEEVREGEKKNEVKEKEKEEKGGRVMERRWRCAVFDRI